MKTRKVYLTSISMLLIGILFIVLMAALPKSLASSTVTTTSGDTPLYGTFEMTFNAPGVSGNKFTQFVAVTFSKGGRTFNVEGFYDGGDTWRARFMPDQEGTWNYSWSFNGSSGSGSFNATPKTNPKARGHVRLDPNNLRYMVYDDGGPFYWYEGKWLDGPHYGPASKGGETNGAANILTPYLAYLDTLETYEHNGVLLKTSLYPLENDKLSWDLPWIQTLDSLVQNLAQRGVYAQVGFFDTWARDKNRWFFYNTDGSQQVFNVWANGDEAAKENYIRYLVARYAGYYNVFWELGNEMDVLNSGFVPQANSKYIPWFRQYEPYGVPIGLSEKDTGINANVDIVQPHQTTEFPPTNATQPWIMNELVAGCSTGDLWADAVIRNGNSRGCYRRTFWWMFTYGGTGTGEATWLDVRTSLNSAVLNVMGDQQRLRNFVDALPVNINEMGVNPGFVKSGPGSYQTRRKAGQVYVSYFLGSAGSGSVTVDLPAGNYDYKWYNPQDGTYSGTSTITAGSGNETLTRPGFSEDTVLLITAVAPPPTGGLIYLSDLNWASATTGWGTVQKNASVGGTTLSLNGTTYSKGIGTHAHSEIVYNLGGNYVQFLSDVGVDDQKDNDCNGSGGSVTFQVYVDGVQKFDGGAINTNDPTQTVSVDVSGANELKLVVTDGGDGISCDWGDWADARLTAVVKAWEFTSDLEGWGVFSNDIGNLGWQSGGFMGGGHHGSRLPCTLR